MEFTKGQKASLKVIAISKDCVFLDIGQKAEGILPLETEEDNNIQVGDTIEVYFVGEKSGEMQFARRFLQADINIETLELSYSNKIAIEGKISKEIKGGYEVRLTNSVRAFCPYSQLPMHKKDESFIGKTLQFFIIKFEENGKNLVVSSRAVEDAKYKEKTEKLFSNIKKGDSVTGTVKSIQKYGAFVDIGGFEALLPIGEVSFCHIDDLSQVLKVGDSVTCRVIKVDSKAKRLSISLKATLQNPWETVAQKYSVGTKYEGKIVRIMDFGLFVELEAGIEGLLHISKLGMARGTNLKKRYNIGNKIAVIIEEIDTKNRKMSFITTQETEQEANATQYMESHKKDDAPETYNPFLSLLKK